MEIAIFVQFIQYDSTRTGGHLRLTLDRNNGPATLALFSQDVTDYLSALMAPIATGENLSQAKYLDLVSRMYGPRWRRKLKGPASALPSGSPGRLPRWRGEPIRGNRSIWIFLWWPSLFWTKRWYTTSGGKLPKRSFIYISIKLYR